MKQITKHNIRNYDFESISVDDFWNIGSQREHKMHRIHAYPAKFPAFITEKAIAYGKKHGVKEIHTIADIFCGCGTTAFEAKWNNINFWGCDINPVATLIARTKSRAYQLGRLQNYYSRIKDKFSGIQIKDQFENANERLVYWYDREHYNDLFRLKAAIQEVTRSDSDYRLFFLCAFSNILKSTSKWLAKSIKPQLDPNKHPTDVLTAFENQYKMMFSACDGLVFSGSAETEIHTANFLDTSLQVPEMDMIITSPPYVTSYEYADLHQLSTLWLDYTDDYKKFRKGTIGSLYNAYDFGSVFEQLNRTGKEIVEQLLKHFKAKARSVAKYFMDMQQVAQKTHSILSNQGMAVFVIGNTEYKGVRIDNAKHLVESMLNTGFSKVSVTKRKISFKILTPYRDKFGQFTTNGDGRKVYNEEFIVVGRK